MALSQTQILSLPEPIREHFIKLERDIVAKIAGHIGKIGKLSTTDVLTLDELQRIGFNMHSIQEEIAKTVSRAEEDVHEMFRTAAEAEYVKYKEVYEITGKKWVPFSENDRLMDLVESISRATTGTFENMSGTLGFVNTRDNWQSIATTYRQTVDYAIMQVRTGQTDFYSAMRGAVRTMADNGISRIEWESGYRRRADSSIRQNILGGLSKLSYSQATMIAEEIGANGMEVTFHLGYRPTHDFGGLQYNMSEFNSRILPLMQEWNCYHRAFAIVLGISKPAYTREELDAMIAENDRVRYFEGKGYTQYEAEQKQRRYETAIRQQKDRINALSAAGDTDGVRIAKTKLNQLNASYRDFSSSVELSTKRERTSVVTTTIKETLPTKVKKVEPVQHITREQLMETLSNPSSFEMAIEGFTGQGYTMMRFDPTDPDTVRVEEGIASAKLKWNTGELYRGISLPEGTKAIDIFGIGDIIDQRGLSSWSSDTNIAQRFAGKGEGAVIFVDKTVGERQAISIQSISKLPEEAEVVYSGKVKFEVLGVREGVITVRDKERTVVFVDVRSVN